MGHFTTSGKLYPDGTTIDGFADIDHMSFGATSTPDVINQTAPDSVLEDGLTKRFLFWDTGRRITTKRHVRWTFTNSGNWATWNAIAWYGTPPVNGPPDPTIAVNSYWANNGTLAATAVDSVSESGVPGGQTAWPWASNDHDVRTEWGSGSIAAKTHLTAPGGSTLDFSGLTKIFFGGDPSGVFDENDADIPAGGVVTGVVNTTSSNYSFAQSEGGILLASYVTPAPAHVGPFKFNPEWLWQRVWPWQEVVDPATLIDVLRERGLSEQIERVRGGIAVDEIERLVSGAATMTKNQLTTAVTELRSIINRGEAGLKSLQSLMDKGE